MSSAVDQSARGRVRCNLDLPSVIDDKLQALAQKHQVTKSEIIRNAIKAFAEYEALQDEGFEVSATRVDKDGVKETVKVI